MWNRRSAIAGPYLGSFQERALAFIQRLDPQAIADDQRVAWLAEEFFSCAESFAREGTDYLARATVAEAALYVIRETVKGPLPWEAKKVNQHRAEIAARCRAVLAKAQRGKP